MIRFGAEDDVVGTTVIPIPKFWDERGTFYQVCVPPSIITLSNDGQFVQSRSHANVFRGLHWQIGMSKAIRVIRGKARIFNVNLGNLYTPEVVNEYLAERLSESYKKWNFFELDESDSMWIHASWPVARGIYAMEEDTVVEYICSTKAGAAESFTLNVFDPELGITGIAPDTVIMNDRDKNAPFLSQLRPITVSAL